jgi:predicted unusual protein kinase regulating ubiquinone biosynthesis (AarF/ABC1/UbiB family)
VSDVGSTPDESDAEPPADGIAGGRVRRSAPLLGLTARTAGEALLVGLRSRLTGADKTEFYARTAERYAEVLGSSKGALMKAGQMLSFVSLGPVIGDDLQASLQEALTRLRDDAPPMAPTLAREVLERELGALPETAFAQFDWEPIAAASIGQVHAARLHDGREVAVKIQYPGVAAAISADIKNIEMLVTMLILSGGLSASGMSFDVRGVVQEIAERIAEELDYRLEAANQAEFAELYRGHPFIHVPDVIGELCTGQVLTQELVRGMPWSDACAADQNLRDSWAEAIHRFHYSSYYSFHLINADPHPGNYAFHEDGSVSCFDFGCVKRFEPEQGKLLNAIVRECLRGDVHGTWRASVESGFFASSDPLTPEEVFAYWRGPIEMYWGQQPFTITPEYAAKAIELRYSPTGPSANAIRHLVSPTAFAIMGRIDLGVISLISELHATNHWQSILAEHIEGGDPITPMGKADRAYREERRATPVTSDEFDRPAPDRP